MLFCRNQYTASKYIWKGGHGLFSGQYMKKWVTCGVLASCLLAAEFPWHKKGVCKVSSIPWGMEYAEVGDFVQEQQNFQRWGQEWEKMKSGREKREGGTHLGEQGDCKWKQSKEWLWGSIGPLLGLFNTALDLSHSYWRKATAAT